MISLSLPRACTHQGLARALASAETLPAPDGADVVLQLPPGDFLECGAMALLCVWGLDLRHRGGQLRFIGGDLGYLARMDLLHHLGIGFVERFTRRAEAGRFIPLLLVQDDAACDRAVNALCDLVLRRFDDARTFLPAVEWAVNEVIGNILLHAESPVPGAVTAQYFPNRRRLDVAVCDFGRGIKASLAERFQLGSNGEAIRKALSRGVTRDPEIGQGNGLAGTYEIAIANGGELHLWTGDVDLRVRQGRDRGFTALPPTPGTGVFLRLDTTHPVDLANTFIAGTSLSYIEFEADRVLEHGIRVRDECVALGTRAPAAALRRKLQALLPDVRSPVLLDFTNADRVSSSFLDELLGRLAAAIGEKEFRTRVHLVNATPELIAMANVVIDQRLRRGYSDRR